MVVSFIMQNILETLSGTTSITLPAIKENGLQLDYHNNDKPETVYNGAEPPLPFANSVLYHANIAEWKRLTAVDDRCKAVYEVTFDVTDCNFTFKAGDTIGVVPQNNEEEVNAVLRHLDLESLADTSYTLRVDSSIKGCKIPPHIPVKSTLKYLLTHCVDLRSILKKLFLLALSRFTKDEDERKVLEYFCSKEGSTAYQAHILNGNLCVLDIFNIFKSCKPPIEVLIANLPRLLPRPYSIVNTGVKDSSKIKICFSVIDLGNKRRGLTTGWLEKKISNEFELEKDFNQLTINCDIVNNKIPIYLRKNVCGFSLPENLEAPLILVGPGTGVASFIGFLEELEVAKENNRNKTFGDVWLFFGCRDSTLDFIYEKELNGFLSRGVLNKFCTAFSRMDNAVKYVQDAILQEGESIAKLLNDGAFVFVSGDVNTMAMQIKETFVKCLTTYNNKTQEEADKLISDMVKEKRYCVDAWS
ncbi:methionine synthase reductase [Manduca sexta]|uniref:methionine synthase reductase n=1 Tax=Manduca sexta TaxID=7130 RepID=UPI001890A522|nr:methionine synthase reductase [Manduca sexta]